MSTNDKLADSLDYIDRKVSSALAVNMRRLIKIETDKLKIAERKIDAVLPGISTKGADVSSKGRRALRALLLCQKLYLEKPCQEFNYLDTVPKGWPTSTIDKWGKASETDIKRAIQMYMPLPNASPESLLAACASDKPDNKNRLIVTQVTRADHPFPVETTCYRAVMSWLLASGYVTLQWFLRGSVDQSDPDNHPICDQLLQFFGQGDKKDVTNSDDVERIVRTIQAGEIVYMYRAKSDGNPKPAGQLGHWMVSEGNGMAYGCCNFIDHEAEGTNGSYDRASLANQIHSMRRGKIKPDEKDYHYLQVFQPGALEA